MSHFPANFDELNRWYAKVQGNRPDLVREYCRVTYPRFKPNTRSWSLMTSETDSVGSYSEICNGRNGGFNFIYTDDFYPPPEP